MKWRVLRSSWTDNSDSSSSASAASAGTVGTHVLMETDRVFSRTSARPIIIRAGLSLLLNWIGLDLVLFRLFQSNPMQSDRLCFFLPSFSLESNPIQCKCRVGLVPACGGCERTHDALHEGKALPALLPPRRNCFRFCPRSVSFFRNGLYLIVSLILGMCVVLLFVVIVVFSGNFIRLIPETGISVSGGTTISGGAVSLPSYVSQTAASRPDFTLSFWFYFTSQFHSSSADKCHTLVGKGCDGSCSPVCQLREDMKLRVLMATDHTEVVCCENCTVSAGRWTHVAVVVQYLAVCFPLLIFHFQSNLIDLPLLLLP